MFKNYIVTAYRNLLKTRVFSVVNILGLAIGMTACLLILHYVTHEKSFDRFHENSDRIYRLRYERTDEAGQAVRFASCCPPAAARIRGNYPEVEKIGRVLSYQGSVSYRDKIFLEERMFFAEPEFLEVLKFKFIEGDPLTGIREPNAAFISRSTAEKYFGDQNPIGETFSVNKKTDYKITGIFEDIPANSHIKFDFLLPWENLAKMMGPEYTEAWGHTGAYTYLKVQPGTDPRAFEKKLLTLVAAECPWLAEYHMTIDLVMQPLTDIHLASHFMQEFEANGDRDAVNLLLLVAVFIMIMAWINYINLSTAFSLNRAKEVGLRKVIGASRRQLTVQFFLEVAVINLFSILAAVWFISLLLPLFGDLTGVPPEYSIWSQSWFLVALAVIFAGGVLFSGLYPVMILSSFRPASVLKGKLWNSARGVKLRRALVISQFTVGVVLIIATMTVYRQISFMRSQEPGFRMDHTLVVKAPRVRDENYGPKFETFRENLLRRPDINRISHVTEVPGRQIYWDAGGIHKAGTDIDQSKNYQIVGVDYDFADVFELKFAAGRNFSKEFPADKTALILNETAVSYMGFVSPDSAIGQKVDYWGEIYPIIGVLKNYHQQSLKEEFEPHIFRFEPYGRGSMGMIAFTLKASDVRETVAAVKQQYDEFFPDNPFNYFFLDDYFNQQYRADELFGKVYSMFALLAVVITALGVYGLSSYSITRHTKEIGIRKVLGASVANIVRLLTREYIVLIVIANLIAWPIAWVTMNRWLENFAWRTTLGIGVFVLAGVFILLVALLTVGYKVYRAARRNPVDTLLHE